MRIFYIEPFLIKPIGHFIQMIIAIRKYLNSADRVKSYFIGNVRMEESIKRFVPEAIPKIRLTCFEKLESDGIYFLQDLIKLDKKFSFNKDDLIIISTAYINEIKGAINFKKLISVRCPKIAIEIHQLFPPAKEFNELHEIKFQHYWESKLRDVLRDNDFSQISIWTSESKKLRNDIQNLTKIEVNCLPFPYRTFIKSKKTNYKLTTTIGFLGDGRQEKGLILFLKMIKKNRNNKSLKFIIQNLNPRGYSQKQLIVFRSLLDEIKLYNNVSIFNKGLNPIEFHKILIRINVVVLPYDPISYNRRISAILIQSAMYGIPCIVSNKTWCKQEISKKHAAGIIFHYSHSFKSRVLNLNKAVSLFLRNKEKYFVQAKKRSFFYIKNNCAENYVNRIIKFYEKN